MAGTKARFGKKAASNGNGGGGALDLLDGPGAAVDDLLGGAPSVDLTGGQAQVLIPAGITEEDILAEMGVPAKGATAGGGVSDEALAKLTKEFGDFKQQVLVTLRTIQDSIASGEKAVEILGGQVGNVALQLGELATKIELLGSDDDGAPAQQPPGPVGKPHPIDVQVQATLKKMVAQIEVAAAAAPDKTFRKNAEALAANLQAKAHPDKSIEHIVGQMRALGIPFDGDDIVFVVA